MSIKHALAPFVLYLLWPLAERCGVHATPELPSITEVGTRVPLYSSSSLSLSAYHTTSASSGDGSSARAHPGARHHLLLDASTTAPALPLQAHPQAAYVILSLLPLGLLTRPFSLLSQTTSSTRPWGSRLSTPTQRKTSSPRWPSSLGRSSWARTSSLSTCGSFCVYGRLVTSHHRSLPRHVVSHVSHHRSRSRCALWLRVAVPSVAVLAVRRGRPARLPPLAEQGLLWLVFWALGLVPLSSLLLPRPLTALTSATTAGSVAPTPTTRSGRRARPSSESPQTRPRPESSNSPPPPLCCSASRPLPILHPFFAAL